MNFSILNYSQYCLHYEITCENESCNKTYTISDTIRLIPLKIFFSFFFKRYITNFPCFLSSIFTHFMNTHVNEKKNYKKPCHAKNMNNVSAFCEDKWIRDITSRLTLLLIVYSTRNLFLSFSWISPILILLKSIFELFSQMSGSKTTFQA